MEDNLIYEGRTPRSPGEIDGLDIPNGHVCGECKNFQACTIVRAAIPADRQCSYIPNDFALPGQESQAEEFNRKDEERWKAKYAAP